jgi:outer membrane biosynthesis protein TonB
MNAGWSNSEQWTEAVPEIFKQPMTIAFGGAILAHAIFFLGLPIVAGKDNQPSIADTPLVQLSPQELSLIPPDVTQSKFPAGTLLPSSTGLLTPSILTPSILSPSILSPSMPPLDSGTIFTPRINFGSSSGSSSPIDIYPDGGSSINSGNILSLEAERKKLELEVARKAAAKQVEDQKLTDNARVNKPIGDLPSTTPTPPSGEIGKPTSTSSTTATPLPTSTPRPSNQEIIAANPKNYDLDSKQTGPTIGPTIQQVLGNWYNKPDSKEREIYSGSQKPPEQFQLDTKTKTLPYPIQVDKKPVAVIPDYAQKVKEGKETNGKAIVGIALDGQGKFVSEPSIIQSTGYPVLDAYAIEYVRSRMFPVTGRSGLYVMVIPIDPPVIRPVS